MTDIFGGVDYDKILAMLRLRVYEQGFEDGTSDLTATNCTQTVQDTEVFAGTYSLEVTVPAGQSGYVETPIRPVSANQKVTFSYAHKEDANITSLKLIVVWYRENLHEIDTEEYSLTPSTEWTLDARTVAAPKRAAYMALRIEATAGASDGHIYLDSITIDLAGQIFRVDGAGNLKIADSDVLKELQTKLDVLLSTRASESTLSGIKTQTDKLTFDTSSFLRIALASDEIGLATEATLAAIKNALASVGTDKLLTTPDNPSNLDIALSTRASESTLSGIKTQTDKLQFDANNFLRIALANDEVDIAKEATLSSILSQLDVALSTRAPKDEGETITIATNADISAGVTATLKNFKRWTLYLKAAAAVDITIELSPDGGTTWFEIPESPISFTDAGDDVLEFKYDATDIRLTGSNTSAVTAIIRGVF